MSVSDDLLKKKLRQIFNLKHFANSKQKEAVKAILKRDQDVVISMASGNRKSLCFQLPGIMDDNRITIVCSASASSIKNQIRYLKKYKIDAKSVTSTLNDDEREQLTGDVTKEKPTTRFIYVTPEQATSDYFTNILRTLGEKDKLAYFAVDDAHFASPRLQDYCQDYLTFGCLRPAYPSIPWIALTHNASADVLNDIAQNLQLREPIGKFTKSTFRKNLHYDIIFKNTTLDLFAHLQNFVTSRLETDGSNKASGIIYCKNRETVEMVARELTERGLSTKAHHGGLTTKERKKVFDEWMAGVLPVITTTTASLGTGVEKSTIRVVVHFDVPQSIAGFYKESGMAGRDGKLSYCRIYYCKTDVAAIDSTLKSDIAKSKNENDSRRALRAHADFLKMSGLCETVDCRHKIFSNYFDDTVPNCNGKCDVCNSPNEAKVALELFYRLSAPPPCDTGRSDTLVVCPVIIKSEPGIGHPSEHPQPSRSASPANTIIKEENDRSGTEACNRTKYPNLSEDLFGMQTLPPRNVSPTRTVVKEEPVNRTDPDVENHINNSSAWDMDSKHAIRLLSHSHSRCVSPAETVIDEKPALNSNHTSALSDELFGMQTLPPGNVSPARTVVKEELVNESRRDLISPISESNTTTTSTGATPQCSFIKSEPKSPERPIDGSGIEPLERAISPLSSFTAAENTDLVPTGLLNQPIAPTLSSNAAPGVSSFVMAVKQEESAKESTDQRSRQVSGRESRSPSPTGTIIKDECLSPARNMDFDGGLENESGNSTNRDEEGVSKMLKVESKHRRSSSQGRSTNKVHTASKATTIPPDHKSEMHRDPSTEPEFVSREIVDFREKSRRSMSSRSTVDDGNSTSHKRQRNRSRRESNSRSRSTERFKREYEHRRRSRSRRKERFKRGKERRRLRSGSKERFKPEKNFRRRSRSMSLSSGRSHSRSLSRRRSRSRSKERFNRENERRRSRSRSNERLKRDRKPSSPSSSKRSQKSARYEQTSKRQRHSSERETDVVDDRSYSTLPASTSTKSKRRFSVSPDVSKRGPETEDDSEHEYGWEDPAPPKPIPQDQPKPTMECDDVIQKKMKEFNRKLQNEYDLEVIEASREELYRAIEESIAAQSVKKLNNLDEIIQKTQKTKQDSFMLKLYGTDNFNSWDDDPALSNVENAKKMQPFKTHVPDDVPLYDKMSMKHVINAMKLKPTRVGNELVFHGHIKEIENQFQGRELPQFVMESIRTEKEVIAGLVKKYLLPYYNAGRIVPKELFIDVARRISHIFYERYADEKIIQRYIDDLFTKYGKVTSSTDLIL